VDRRALDRESPWRAPPDPTPAMMRPPVAVIPLTLSRLLMAALAVAPLVAQSGWQLRQQPTPRPPLRSNHALAYDVANARTVLFGGYGFQGAWLGDTWLWNGVAWTQATAPPAPPARLAHTMAYDSIRARTVLFGGALALGADADDTWEWDGAQWAQVQPANRPPSRRGAAMTFDPVRGVCLPARRSARRLQGHRRGDARAARPRAHRAPPPARALVQGGVRAAGFRVGPSSPAEQDAGPCFRHRAR